MAGSGIIDTSQSGELLAAYDFLKKLEGVIRVADLKNTGTFSSDARDDNNHRLGRALGFIDNNRELATEMFMQEYLETTRMVRGHFTALVGELAG